MTDLCAARRPLQGWCLAGSRTHLSAALAQNSFPSFPPLSVIPLLQQGPEQMAEKCGRAVLGFVAVGWTQDLWEAVEIAPLTWDGPHRDCSLGKKDQPWNVLMQKWSQSLVTSAKTVLFLGRACSCVEAGTVQPLRQWRQMVLWIAVLQSREEAEKALLYPGKIASISRIRFPACQPSLAHPIMLMLCHAFSPSLHAYFPPFVHPCTYTVLLTFSYCPAVTKLRHVCIQNKTSKCQVKNECVGNVPFL